MSKRIAAIVVAVAMSCGIAAAPDPAPAASPVVVPASAVRLAPHRAVYDLRLLESRGTRGVDDVRGRIAFDLTGNGCEGYSLRFRQVTQTVSGEVGTRTSDLRSANYESGDGRSFRFRNDSTAPDGTRTAIDGSAEKAAADTLAVRIKRPRRGQFVLGDAVFPNTQMRDIIAAARAGRTLVPMRLFDGSENGHTAYETLTIVGPPIPPGERAGELEPPARQDALMRLKRWPVSISYYATGRDTLLPTYVLSFELYENGVSRALKLDYGDLVLGGGLVLLDLYGSPSPCER